MDPEEEFQEDTAEKSPLRSRSGSPAVSNPSPRTQAATGKETFDAPYFIHEQQNPGFQRPEFLVDYEQFLVVRPPERVKSLEEHLRELTEDELFTLEAFRGDVRTLPGYAAEGHPLGPLDDWMLIRYLRAREFKRDKALKMIQKSMEWAEEAKPLTTRCTKCDVRPDAHCMQFVGWDTQHRPVLYSSHRWSMDRRNTQEAVVHSMEAFQHAIRCMPEGVEQWVAVTDFVTYSHLRDGNPKQSSAVVNMLSDHFPERLGLMILVDPPTLFWVLWKVLSAIIDDRTRAKVKFVYTAAKPSIHEEFPKIFPPQMSSYLIHAFERNKVA